MGFDPIRQETTEASGFATPNPKAISARPTATRELHVHAATWADPGQNRDTVNSNNNRDTHVVAIV
jgi:hypothetical protein